MVTAVHTPERKQTSPPPPKKKKENNDLDDMRGLPCNLGDSKYVTPRMHQQKMKSINVISVGTPIINVLITIQHLLSQHP